MRSHFTWRWDKLNLEIGRLGWSHKTKLDWGSHNSRSAAKAWSKISKWYVLHCRFFESTTYRSIWLIQGLKDIIFWFEKFLFQDWVSFGCTCYVKVLLTDHTSCRHKRETKVSLLTKYIIFVIWWWGLSCDDMRFIMWW